MIYTMSITDCDTTKYDKIYLIVRSILPLINSKHPILKVAEQLDALSPSLDLFLRYRKWEKEGTWGIEKFNSQYAPFFLEDMENNFFAQLALKDLISESDKEIALLCYCKDKNTCHRSLIGKLLKERGCEVIIN